MEYQPMPDLVNLSLKEAKEKAYADGYVVRVVEEDGHSNAITFDLQAFRINVVVQDGVVQSIKESNGRKTW